MAVFRFLCFFVSMLLALNGITQTNTGVKSMLLKRYAKATRWGNGYIVKEKKFCGFANSSGRIIIPVNNYTIDTILPNRAVVYGYKGCWLINENGKNLAPGIYRLLNRKKRLLALRDYEAKESLCNDNGAPIKTETIETNTPKEALLTLTHLKDNTLFYGIITANGDTLLTPQYEKVCHGKNYYAFMKHDTAFVYNHKGKLVFVKNGLQNIEILANDFVVISKYGMCALVNRNGKLVTGFRYTKIDVLNYDDTLLFLNKRHNRVAGIPTNKYFLAGKGFYALIDSSGKEILPLIYDRILMNRKGWLIVRKEGYGTEELLNPEFKEILQTESYGLDFIKGRYVRVEYNRYANDGKIRIYDTQLKRFTDKTFPEEKERYYSFSEPWQDYYTQSYANHYFQDSLIINELGSALVKKNGRWGVRSFSGETILPFIYDTLGGGGSYSYFVGLNKKYALLDWEGRLAMPAELPEWPGYLTGDSLVYSSSNQLYSYKGWRLQKTNVAKEGIPTPFLQIVSGIGWCSGNKDLARGVYNRQIKRLADLPYPTPQYFPNVTYNGVLSIQDSVKKLVTVIDSTGKQLGPWIQIPKLFIVTGEYALAVNDTNQADILFRYNNETNYCDTIWLDRERKKNMLNPYQNRNQYQTSDVWPWRPYLIFEIKGKALGALATHQAVLVPGAEQLKCYDYISAAKIAGKWAVYDWNGKQLLNAEYDSINTNDNRNFKLYKNRKVGIFISPEKKFYNTEFDSIINLQYCLRNNFFIGYKNGLAQFTNSNGQVISTGWAGVTNQPYYVLSHIPAQRNGISYLLYPSGGDSLEAVPVKDKAPVFDKEEYLSFSYARVTVKNKQGIYDKVEKTWIVPAEYDNVDGFDGYFAARIYEPPSTSIYTAKGRKLFSVNALYYEPNVMYQNQFQMGGTYDGPILNCRGKVILSDTFKYINSFYQFGKPLYYARGNNEKYLVVDTSGKILIPPILSYIDETPMHQHYIKVWANNKSGLIGPNGKLIANCIYEDITNGSPRKREIYSGYYYQDEDKTPVLYDPYFVVTKGTRDKFKFGVIDGKGRPVVPCMYDSVLYILNAKLVVVKKGTHWGLISVTNKQITDFIYDFIDEYGTLEFRRGKVHGYLSTEGKETIVNY